MKKLAALLATFFALTFGLSVVAQNEISGFGVEVKTADSPSVDAFGRWRVAESATIFESKQIFDNQPLFWDESLESGAGITSSYSQDTASTVFTSTLNTAGLFTRQTFARFNYHPGKSHLIYVTAVLDLSGGGTGVQRRVGYFDDGNGVFFEDDEGTIKVVVRSSTTGSPVNTKIAQSSWNVDKLDGTGPSGLTADWTKSQLFSFDFQWLGVGRIRYGVEAHGRVVVVHEVLNANVTAGVYMSTPNLPLRYQMVTTGSSPASTMEAMCSTVISEGGQPVLGVDRVVSTSGTHIDATTENVFYAIVGVRLKAANLGAAIRLGAASVAEHVGGKEFEWCIFFNPTVAGTFTYSDVTNSSAQSAFGATANTVTGGICIAGGFASSADKGGSQTLQTLSTTLRLGAAIDGTRDTLVLAVKPVGGSSGIDVEGSLTFREP